MGQLAGVQPVRRYHTQESSPKTGRFPSETCQPCSSAGVARPHKLRVQSASDCADAAQEPAEGQLAGVQPVRRYHTQELNTKVPGPSPFRDTPAAAAKPQKQVGLPLRAGDRWHRFRDSPGSLCVQLELHQLKGRHHDPAGVCSQPQSVPALAWRWARSCLPINCSIHRQ